jgi:O-antigen/teichoic acid export membrane protein
MQIRRRTIPPGMLLISSFAGSSVANYLFGLTLGWLLVPSDFGLLAFAQTVLLIAGLVLNSGFTWSLNAAIVGMQGEERATRVRGALAANLLAALAIGGLLLLLFAIGPLRRGFEHLSVAVLVVATLPLISTVTVTRAAAQGSERFGFVATLQIVEVVGKVVAGITLTALGYGAPGAISGFTIGSLIAAMLGLTIMVRHLDIGLRGRVVWPSMRIARSMFGAVLGMSLLLNLDLSALKLLSDGDRAFAGYYQAGLILANTPYFMMSALMPLLFTRTTRAGSLAAASGLTRNALQQALIFLVPIELVLAIAPGAVLALLFPPSYAPAAETLRILALGNCAVLLILPFANALQATGKAYIVARVLLSVAFVEALALWVFVPIWHGPGAAMLFLVAACTSLIVLTVCYVTLSGVGGLRDAAVWLMRYSIALVVWGGVAGTVHAAGFHPILAAVTGGPVYLIMILLFNLIDLPRNLRNLQGLRWAGRSR